MEFSKFTVADLYQMNIMPAACSWCSRYGNDMGEIRQVPFKDDSWLKPYIDKVFP